MYKFIIDPAHGWLEVKESELLELGLKPSSFSYIDPVKRLVYLEEDMDAPAFIKAKQLNKDDIQEVNHNLECFVRELPRLQVA